jgi:1-acyl-sn-glycerol-3-phosphate acyltransferase
VALSRARQAALVAWYTVAFWLLLPAALWLLSARLDRAAGWARAPRPAGWLLAAAGLALAALSMVQLCREGKGLPVSALPPPRLAQRGPYGLLRHPLYAGYSLAAIGAGLGAGSTALAAVVGPSLVVASMIYAALEERGLLRRFGDAYRHYRRRTGFFPRFPAYGLLRLVGPALLPARVEGRERIPCRGPAVLVSNHACYLDFMGVGQATWRPVRFLVTAEAYRGGALALALRRMTHVPMRRYRVDPAACREMLRFLSDGDLASVAPEGERSPLGDLQRPLPNAARVLSRLGVPVIPVGVSGSYDVGPRWARKLRRRRVRVRVGPPLDFRSGDPGEVIRAALRTLLDEDPQPVHLEGLDRSRLEAVLWRCPRCRDEPGWRAADLACGACGARWVETPDGRFDDGQGRRLTLAEVARPIWTAGEDRPLAVRALGWEEPSVLGRIGPLEPLGEGELRLSPLALRFRDLAIPVARLRVVNTERADTLQISTGDAMWQFRPLAGSVFRLQRALEVWMEAGP